MKKKQDINATRLKTDDNSEALPCRTFWPINIATKPPTINCQNRVNDEKKAKFIFTCEK